MAGRALPTGRELRARFIALVSTCGIATAALTIAYLVGMLRMPVDQIAGLVWIVAGLSVLATPISMRINAGVVRPLCEWLDAREANTADPERTRRAFECVVNLPRRGLLLAFGLFFVPATVAVLALWLTFPDFPPASAGLMLSAIVSVSLIAALIEAFVLKRWLTPIRRALTLELPDAAEREQLTRAIPLATKLQVVIAACTLVPVVFCVFMALTHSSVPVERLTGALQKEALEAGLERHRATGSPGLADLSAARSSAALPIAFFVFDVEQGVRSAGDEDPLSNTERELIVESRGRPGTGAALDSENIFSWAPLDGERRVLVAASPRAVVVGDRTELIGVFVALLVGSLGIALSAAWLVAQDVGGATRRLRAAAERVASGDLRRLEVMESEDELGELGRAFEGMVQALRSTVGGVIGAAEGVDAATHDISRVTEGLSHAAGEQGQEVKQVVVAMEEVGEQISGIAGNSDELSQLVEESTSSILELGSSGEQLSQTAGVLSSRVDEVSSSVEQMVCSVREVASNTQALADAASETSSSMSEMESAMRAVDSNAVETSALSEQVVQAAELGRERVSLTIEGIESIKHATETAQRVILSLGDRTQEIGSILDVIDDVADETNLLALNAAIIAAQAGEHGKSFSVVADEIKELADRVLSSTKEIGSLIQSVQDESRSAIDAMEEGSRSVDLGVQRSMEAGEALEEITRHSRNSGTWIREIVSSVQEQTRAAGHVVVQMERVKDGVEAIRRAGDEQERGNEVVFHSTQAMREVARQLHSTTREQSNGLGRIRENIGGVRDTTESINSALQGQSAACSRVVGFLEEVSSRSMANETSARQVKTSIVQLLEQAERLRRDVARFER